MTENSHQLPVDPPPAYGAVTGSYPPQAAATSASQQPPITEPPPKYEPPKDGPYAQQPQYTPQQPYAQVPYPQQAYPTAAPTNTQGTATVITITEPHFCTNPMPIKCPHCQAEGMTTVSYTSGCLTWLTSAFLCFIGAWVFGGCLIPFCIPAVMDVEHQCSYCGKHLGTYNRL